MSYAPTDVLFDEILDFLASAPTPQQIITYQPSQKLQARMSELLELNRKDSLSERARDELNEFLRMNRFMSRLKLKARQRLAS